MKGNRNNVAECTSSQFDGVISLVDPEKSWVARWQRIDGKDYCKGVYAVVVHGRLPSDIIEELNHRGKQYIARDHQ